MTRSRRCSEFRHLRLPLTFASAHHVEDAATANGRNHHRLRSAKQKPLVRMAWSNTVVLGPLERMQLRSAVQTKRTLALYQSGERKNQVIAPVKYEGINQIEHDEGHIHDKRLPQPNL